MANNEEVGETMASNEAVGAGAEASNEQAGAPVEPSLWENFNKLPDEHLTVLFSLHIGTTELYNGHMSKPELSSNIHPYTESSDIFLVSNDLASKSLDRRTNDLMNATRNLFEAVLQGGSGFPDETVDQITRHALALARTSPDLFGPNFKLNLLARRAEFTMAAMCGDLTHPHQRYDIVQWIVCFKLLGKAFDLEGWEPVYASSLVEAPDPKQVVAKVSFGRDIRNVTQEAKEAMDYALASMAARPKAFFSCMQAAVAVVKILDKELLEYTMPQSLDELEAFNWANVVVDLSDTYPEAPQPSEADFAVIKAVYQLSKE
jgi:hypothetical protein